MLDDDGLDVAGRDVGHRLHERPVDREHGRARRLLVADVDDGHVRFAIVVEQASQLGEHHGAVRDAKRPCLGEILALNVDQEQCGAVEVERRRAHANALRTWRTPTMAAAVSAMPSARRLATSRSTRATAAGRSARKRSTASSTGAPRPATMACSVRSRRVAWSSSRTAASAQRCQRVSAGMPPSCCSSQSRCSRSPSAKNACAASASEQPVARAAAITSGACVRSGRQAAASASGSGSPRCASASRRSAWSARQTSLPTPRSVCASSLNDARSRAITAAASPSFACWRYQRDTPSTSSSTPLMTSICTSVSTAGSANSASTSSQRPTAPVTSRAIQ